MTKKTNSKDILTYCGLFLAHSVINCSEFMLYALLNSNICLDGIQPVCYNCLYRTELVWLVPNIHEAVSWQVAIYLIFTSSHQIKWWYFWAIIEISCLGDTPVALIHISWVFSTKMAPLLRYHCNFYANGKSVFAGCAASLLTCTSACAHHTGHVSLCISIRTRVKQLCVDLC